MNINKLIGIHIVQGWWRDRAATLGNLRRPGKRSWKREAILLLSISLALTACYFTAYHFASHALRELVNACSARFEIELENADIEPPMAALPQSLCECLARTFLDKNGVVRLALVDSRLLDPLALEPVTDEDGEACINALWESGPGLAKRLTLE
ncbi:hypothetical protein T3H00_27395 [Pseudomonas fluorescens]|jgi:hypothetical protein|uniref:hypothetical protein n=1 Tax=Pseudomonas TaxID=286 RepID=UPI001A92EE41|nr:MULTISPECIES: hypothetical protein [Pseudomonas]MDZ5436378.1 hypothetical protein [Pseudomonas fluorescens]